MWNRYNSLRMRFTARLRIVTRVTHCLQIVPRQREVGVVIDANDVVDHGTGAAAHDARWVGTDKHTTQFAPCGRLVKR